MWQHLCVMSCMYIIRIACCTFCTPCLLFAGLFMSVSCGGGLLSSPSFHFSYFSPRVVRVRECERASRCAAGAGAHRASHRILVHDERDPVLQGASPSTHTTTPHDAQQSAVTATRAELQHTKCRTQKPNLPLLAIPC
jgi:hypothetical protein